MLELDYAFLADFATIQDGKLTTVGGSFTKLIASEFPSQALIAVAGRVRCDEPEVDVIPVTVRVMSPDDVGMTVEATTELDASEERHAPYEGHRRGIVFALQMNLPILSAGVYTVEIDLEGTDGVDRTLKFRACLPEVGE